MNPVAGEVEDIDFNFGFLTDLNEADVAIRHHGFDFKVTVGRYHDEPSSGWRDNARMAKKIDTVTMAVGYPDPTWPRCLLPV